MYICVCMCICMYVYIYIYAYILYIHIYSLSASFLINQPVIVIKEKDKGGAVTVSHSS